MYYATIHSNIMNSAKDQIISEFKESREALQNDLMNEKTRSKRLLDARRKPKYHNEGKSDESEDMWGVVPGGDLNSKSSSKNTSVGTALDFDSLIDDLVSADVDSPSSHVDVLKGSSKREKFLGVIGKDDNNFNSSVRSITHSMKLPPLKSPNKVDSSSFDDERNRIKTHHEKHNDILVRPN